MKKVNELLGDALSSVTTGCEVKTSDFGNAAMVSCFVRLTCGQTEETISKAMDLAGTIARTYVDKELPAVEEILDKAMGRMKPQSTPKAPKAEVIDKVSTPIKRTPIKISANRPTFKP